MRSSSRHGFTLVELMVAVVITGVVSTALVQMLTPRRPRRFIPGWVLVTAQSSAEPVTSPFENAVETGPGKTEYHTSLFRRLFVKIEQV